MDTLKVTPLRTEILRLNENLAEFILRNMKGIQLKEGAILAVTSKIVSLSEGRVVAQNSIDKASLIKREADHDLGEVGYGCRLTIKDGLFIPSAGIDESNSESGGYILFPKDAFASAKRLHQQLSESLRLKTFGILITDSHTLPLRHGVTGIALAYWGFEGVKNRVGDKDLFGRELKMTKMDLADGLAAAAVMMMGEADECCPLAIIENAPVKFVAETNPVELQIPVEQDIYYPIYQDRLNK